MLQQRTRAKAVGLTALALAASLGGCRSEAPPAAEPGKPGYYTGKMAPNGRGRFDDGPKSGGQPGSGGAKGSRAMGG